MSMTPHTKGIPRKPMRMQLRGEGKKLKPIKTNQRRRHGKDLKQYRKPRNVR